MMTPATSCSSLQMNIIITVLALWLVSQILIPLRHLLYPGNVSWSEEGHRFSWQMKLRDKSGYARIYVVDKSTQQRWQIDPRQYLTRKQVRKMTTRPDMTLQFAHYLAQVWKETYKIEDVAVYATVYVSLNGRKPALMLDPEHDLASTPRDLTHARWILPLQEPFRWLERNS
jgi:hypothetical protein